jgi:RimJ/RimL family protein N-acetyltransferase
VTLRVVDGDLKLLVLQTMRLTLSLCRPDDGADFMALERDPEVMRFLNGGHAVDHSRSYPDATFLMPRGTESHVWTARRTANGSFVGWFCLWPESKEVGELGYRLRRLDWGQGLASEGAFALIGWGFRNGGFESIFASTSAVNHASRRVLEKLGMRCASTVKADGTDPIPGGEEGEVVYELMRSEWDDGSPRSVHAMTRGR